MVGHAPHVAIGVSKMANAKQSKGTGTAVVGKAAATVAGNGITAKQLDLVGTLTAKPSAKLLAAQTAVLAYLKAQGAVNAAKAVTRTQVWLAPGTSQVACLTLRAMGVVGRTPQMGLYLTGKAPKAKAARKAKAPKATAGAGAGAGAGAATKSAAPNWGPTIS